MPNKSDHKVYRVGNYVNKGGFRQSWECADDDTKLLKFDGKTPRPPRKNRGLKRLRREFRNKLGLGTRHLSGNHDEIMGWRVLEDKGLAGHRYFTKVYGMVETDRGPALMIERITNFWNSDTKTIRQYLRKHKNIQNPELREALTKYFDVLREHKLAAFADRPENIAIVVDENGKLYCKSFDVKPYYNHHLIPIYEIKLFKNIRTQRRLKRHLEILLDKNYAVGKGKL
ncbi:YrbL family protein [Flexibacterium corallicola]|uniref:YrbL family protein n=1 Tax=Flexibacterium corallicola TaxID=3037259 RepID=UPI00286F9F0A|nr:YrbL family protein [Pseudovibrio sp. M1P-2-3]